MIVSELANLKQGYDILIDAVPETYYNALSHIRAYFLQTDNYKKQHIHAQQSEMGYRDLKHKEMFFIRDQHLPIELLSCRNLAEDLHKESLRCLQMICNELQLEPRNLTKLVDTEALPQHDLSSSILRLIHYQAGHSDDNACAIHQDLGLLTLICPTSVPALEIYDCVGDKAWFNIEEYQGVDDMVVMVGESLSLLSNNYFIPATHRVRVPREPRLSIFYQLRFKHNAIIDSRQFETAITGKFSKPFCLTGEEYLQSEIKMRSSVNGSY